MVVSDSVENGVFEFIHSSTQRGVIVSKSSEPYYASRYISAARVFGKISDTSPSMPEEVECIEQTEVADGLFHIVRRGETLYSIAKHYRISVNSLKPMNNLAPAMRADISLRQFRQAEIKRNVLCSVVNVSIANLVHKKQESGLSLERQR